MRLPVASSPRSPSQAGARTKLLWGRCVAEASSRHWLMRPGLPGGEVSPGPWGTPRPARGFGRFLWHPRPLIHCVWHSAWVRGLEYVSN